MENDHWFTAPDKTDYREVVDYMNQWQVWGAVRFTDDCDNCFDGGIKLRINESEELISLPASINEVKSRVACVE